MTPNAFTLITANTNMNTPFYISSHSAARCFKKSLSTHALLSKDLFLKGLDVSELGPSMLVGMLLLGWFDKSGIPAYSGDGYPWDEKCAFC